MELIFDAYNRLKSRELNNRELLEIANRAAKLRFPTSYNELDYEQLLNVNRKEDEGNNLWLVYNRIQENLTKSGLLNSRNGNRLSGVENEIGRAHV